MKQILVIVALVALGVALIQLSDARWFEQSQQAPPPSLPVEARRGGPPDPRWRGPPNVLYGQTVRVVVRGDDIYASITVDVLSRDTPSRYGKVVYGEGYLEVGGVRYEVKSIEGWLTQREFRVDIYTGREYIELRVADGVYTVEIRVLGRPGYVERRGAATFEVS